MVTLRLLANPKVKARVTEGRAQAMIQSRHWRRDYAMDQKQLNRLASLIFDDDVKKIPGVKYPKGSPTT